MRHADKLNCCLAVEPKQLGGVWKLLRRGLRCFKSSLLSFCCNILVLKAFLFRTAVSSEKYANVVVCSDPLVAAVAQLLLAGLAPAVPIENIYSTSKAGRVGQEHIWVEKIHSSIKFFTGSRP